MATMYTVSPASRVDNRSAVYAVLRADDLKRRRHAPSRCVTAAGGGHVFMNYYDLLRRE